MCAIETKPRTKHILAVLLFILWGSAGTLQAQDHSSGASKDWLEGPQSPALEFFVSSLFINSTTDGSLGLRGSRPVRGRLHLEAGASRIEDSDVDLWLVDLSAKYYLLDRPRSDLYLVAGPGLFYSSDLDAEEWMLHLGLGYEFNWGRRFYLRPEVRGRWFAEDLGDTNILDVSVGFGWRL